VFVHGLGSSKDSPRNVVIAENLVDAGVAAVLFDLSGHGESSSDPRQGIDAYVDDLDAVFAWMQRQPELDAQRIGVSGSSLGAVVAMQAVSGGRVRPRTMVLRAPPADPEEFARLDVPSLVLIGSHDPLLAAARAGVALCPTAQLSVVEGASHLFDEPGTLEEAVERTVDWFRRILPAETAPGPPSASRGARITGRARG
jgi:alpha-beta hydrolase superfamily lysophospholipase